MADQTINVTMHTLNKYGVPCTDVTEYVNGSSAGGSDTIYLQKTKYSYIVKTKLKSSGGGGIPGYLFCWFENDQDVWEDDEGNIGKGYCKYYSLENGELVKTVELPTMIGGESSYMPMVDIKSNVVVYSPYEFDGDVTKYGRFQRDDAGNLTMVGRMALEKPFYMPNSVLYLGGTLTTNPTQPAIPPREFLPSAVDPETNTFTIPNHGFTDDMSEWVMLWSTGSAPGGLVLNHWYVVVNTTQDTFQLAKTPYDINPYTGDPIDIGNSGTGIHTLVVDIGSYCYDGNVLLYDLVAIRPTNIHNNHIYSNVFGEDRQTGRYYYEALPGLSADNENRMALGKEELFVGELAPGTDYVIKVPFSQLLDPSYPGRDTYTYEVDIFNDSVDDGSGKYIVGSGQIQGVWMSNQLFILTSYDDIRGGSGNQAYQKWYDSDGHFLYDWVYPSYMEFNPTTALFEEKFYAITGRIDHGSYFFYVIAHPTTKESWLLVYHNLTGQLTQTLLPNPYKDDESYYTVINRQLIADRYIMLHTTSDHYVFFDAYGPGLGIRGEIHMPVDQDVAGFFVIPKFN